MKIAISAKGRDLESPVDPRFGRAEGFLIYDTSDNSITYLHNSIPNNQSQGIGIKVAQMIVNSGTERLITGQMGPKAASVLTKKGIKLYECSSGSAQEAVEALKQGQLPVLKEESIQSGPGKMGGRGAGGGGRGGRRGGP